jgi:integrase
MKKHLTNLAVERLRPPKKGQTEVFDLGYPGLALRVGHGGAKAFTLFYRNGGKLHRVTLGRWPEVSLAGARDAWRKTREAIANGGGIPLMPDKGDQGMLFERVAEEWLKRDQSGNKSLYQITRLLEVDLLPAWRGRRVDHISKRDIHELLDSIADRGAPTMAGRVQAYVRRFFRWCLERDLIKVDPTAGMARIGNGKSRDRVLDDAELKKVWNGAEQIGLYGSIIRLLILTGARREEITQLRWDEVEGDCINLAGDRTKNGEVHVIPLSKPALAIINSVNRIAESPFVFTTSGDKPLAGWSRVKIDLDAASGVTNWRIHDLRRTMATGIQKLGVTLQVVEAVLGHTSGSRAGIVGVYQRHSFADEKRAALEQWGAKVREIVS